MFILHHLPDPPRRVFQQPLGACSLLVRLHLLWRRKVNAAARNGQGIVLASTCPALGGTPVTLRCLLNRAKAQYQRGID
jgi:hypothetical protein